MLKWHTISMMFSCVPGDVWRCLPFMWEYIIYNFVWFVAQVIAQAIPIRVHQYFIFTLYYLFLMFWYGWNKSYNGLHVVASAVVGYVVVGYLQCNLQIASLLARSRNTGMPSLKMPHIGTKGRALPDWIIISNLLCVIRHFSLLRWDECDHDTWRATFCSLPVDFWKVLIFMNDLKWTSPWRFSPFAVWWRCWRPLFGGPWFGWRFEWKKTLESSCLQVGVDPGGLGMWISHVTVVMVPPWICFCWARNDLAEELW